ncbi:hypothetical protein D3C86_1683710 [compost metagenome]
MLLLQCAQDRQGDGVVAAEGQGDDAVVEDFVVGSLDDANGLGHVEGIDWHIADIGHVQRIERGGAGGHVVRADHHRLGADLARAETGAGTQRGADIQRYADKADVQGAFLIRGLDMRQAHHGGYAAETGHLIAAQGLVQSLVHGKASRLLF